MQCVGPCWGRQESSLLAQQSHDLGRFPEQVHWGTFIQKWGSGSEAEKGLYCGCFGAQNLCLQFWEPESSSPDWDLEQHERNLCPLTCIHCLCSCMPGSTAWWGQSWTLQCEEDKVCTGTWIFTGLFNSLTEWGSAGYCEHQGNPNLHLQHCRWYKTTRGGFLILLIAFFGMFLVCSPDFA